MTSAIVIPWLAGHLPELPTPFDDAGRIDIGAFARLCERQIAAGASAMVVCETAGEASTLSASEREFVIRAAVDVGSGRVRIIAGAVSNATDQAVQLVRRAEACGADAVLSVVPYYNKPTQGGIHAHFQAIGASTGLPIILHDIPSRCVRQIADETLVALGASGCIAGMLDGSGDVTRPIRLKNLLPSGFRLLSGDDATSRAYVACGGDGCVSTISNIAPELIRPNSLAMDHTRFLTLPSIERHLRLQMCIGQQDPAALKYALSLLGLGSPAVRLPLTEPDETKKAQIVAALGDMRPSNRTNV